jgi:phytoene synthase
MTDAARQRTDDAAFCADLVRASDFDRYAATLFVDAEARRGLLALFAFNVEIARVRGQTEQPLAGEIRLQWWTDCLSGLAHGDAEANPVAAELLRAIETFGLPADALVRLVEAHRFDLYDDPLASEDELNAYLDATAGTLFRLAEQILARAQEPAADASREAGRAFGLLRIMEIVGLTSSRGQLYLPLEWLEQSGADAADLFAGRATPAIRILLDEACRRARIHLDAARAAIAESPAPRAFLTLALIDARLRRIENPAFQPFVPEPSRLTLVTLWTLWRASHRQPFRR